MVKKLHIVKDDSTDNDSDSDKKREKKLKKLKDKKKKDKKKKKDGITININIPKSGGNTKGKGGRGGGGGGRTRGMTKYSAGDKANIKPTAAHAQPLSVGNSKDKNDSKAIEKLNDATQSIQREMRESNRLFLANQLHNENEMKLIKQDGMKALTDIYSVVHNNNVGEDDEPVISNHPQIKEYKIPGRKPGTKNKPKTGTIRDPPLQIKITPVKGKRGRPKKEVVFENDINEGDDEDEQIRKDIIAEENKKVSANTRSKKGKNEKEAPKLKNGLTKKYINEIIHNDNSPLNSELQDLLKEWDINEYDIIGLKPKAATYFIYEQIKKNTGKELPINESINSFIAHSPLKNQANDTNNIGLVAGGGGSLNDDNDNDEYLISGLNNTISDLNSKLKQGAGGDY